MTSGTYKIRATSETTDRDETYGEMTPYCTVSGVSRSGISYCYSNRAWGSAEVTGYANQMATDGFSSSNIKSVYAHEFGHALSMDHVLGFPQLTPFSVMKKGKNNYLPQQIDKDHLRQKWGR